MAISKSLGSPAGFPITLGDGTTVWLTASVVVDAAGNPVAGGSGASILLPTTWAAPATAQDVRLYSDVEVQFVGTPGTAYTPVRSLDGTNFVATNAYDQDGNVLISISAAGIYSFDGGGYLKFSAGAGSTLTVRGA